ncbi:hypothetical protein CTAYLR_006217 [Chrysophaeum taylorii]|uniref:CRAL-TRIO domain-containing protein n=1 Tax=Chrysophaeum taylorii TaxID=2483200 RepID=A0AAD7U932_9STRA|nr:hypothetical protein CTAYLR_006217 [Chrysophaeum taylorii]
MGSFHGILGCASLVATVVALALESQAVVALCVAASSTLAIHARSLIHLAPAKSTIAPGIVAPHREAFRRTIYMVLYLNLRALGEAGLARGRPYAVGRFLLWTQFLPRSADPNALIFVVPMFLAVTQDAVSISADLGFLLSTQLGALVLSFAFTLAFRKIISIRAAYVFAAAAVAGRFGRIFFGRMPGLALSAAIALALNLPADSAESKTAAAAAAAAAKDLPELELPPGMERWARQSVAIYGKEKAKKVCLNLHKFRTTWGWPLEISSNTTKLLEPALRSGMHWVLPGRDAKGRKVITYRPENIHKAPVPDLQLMMCYLLERETRDLQTLEAGFTIVVDLEGGAASAILCRRRKLLTIADVRRGTSMFKDSFPCRVRAIYVANLPRALLPLAGLVKSALPAKLRGRVAMSHKPPALFPALLADVPLAMLPAAMGGQDARFDWDAQVDKMLLE